MVVNLLYFAKERILSNSIAEPTIVIKMISAKASVRRLFWPKPLIMSFNITIELMMKAIVYSVLTFFKTNGFSSLVGADFPYSAI